MVLLVGEGSDDLAQGEETLVDVYGLLVSHVARKGLALAPCQVHQLQLACHNIIRRLGVHLLDGKAEKGVGTTAAVVHVVGGYDLVPDAEVVQGKDIVRGSALKCVQVLDGEVVVLGPLELEAGAVGDEALELGLVEQVEDLLLVDLKVTAVHCEFLLLNA